MGVLVPALAGLAVVLLAVHLATIALVLRRLSHPLPSSPVEPGRITLLRPIRGLAEHEAETIASSFFQDHPDHELIFCAQVPGDPAAALVVDLIARHPHVPARLLEGDARNLRNFKLRNVWKGWQAATTRRVVMADSNLLLPPDYLTGLARLWKPGVGHVSCPPLGTRPRGWGGHLECAFLNTNQLRLQMAADCLGRGFAQGKTLAYDKPLTDRLGGIEALDRNLAEDVATTRMIRREGLRVRLAPRPFEQPIGRRSLRQVWDRQLRWAVIRREGFPWVYACEPLNGGVLPVAAAVAACAVSGVPLALAAGFALLWYGAEWGLARAAGWPAGWRDVLVMPLRDLMLPAVWLAALFQNRITWHGGVVAAPPVLPPVPAAGKGGLSPQS
jgi:ceramide glucosyltransferase